jgi:hypothetical protein
VSGSDFAGFQYALRFVPARNYTIALTCRGDEELLGESDDLDFQGIDNVEPDDGEVLQHDFD